MLNNIINVCTEKMLLHNPQDLPLMLRRQDATLSKWLPVWHAHTTAVGNKIILTDLCALIRPELHEISKLWCQKSGIVRTNGQCSWVIWLIRNFMPHGLFVILLLLFLPIHLLSLVSLTFQDMFIKLPWVTSLTTHFSSTCPVYYA